MPVQPLLRNKRLHRHDLDLSTLSRLACQQSCRAPTILLLIWLQVHRVLVLVITFLCYATFHASRKPPAIVKTVLRGSSNATALHAPINQLNATGGGSNDYLDFLAGKYELVVGSWHPMTLSAALHAAASLEDFDPGGGCC